MALRVMDGKVLHVGMHAQLEQKKYPVCKKMVPIVGEGDNRRYAQHGCKKSGKYCVRSLARISRDKQ